MSGSRYRVDLENVIKKRPGRIPWLEKRLMEYATIAGCVLALWGCRQPIRDGRIQLPRDAEGRIVVDTHPDAAYLAPQESMARIHVPEGYRLELVASEPDIAEPVAIAWDGDGRLYVAEMRTYMQDLDGTGLDEPRSRITRLEDTDGDGIFDRRTVFIDSLVLPRMLLCVGDRLLVAETYGQHIYAFMDTDGDGRADRRDTVLHDPGIARANLEHQRSGLLWNLDNYIYVTVDASRYRYRDGKLVAEPLPDGSWQWGLANDAYGRLYHSAAGFEVPAFGFQLAPHYGSADLEGQLAPGFVEVWPAIATPDVQGGPMRLRADSTLNHFTASCGHSLYTGGSMPALEGDLLICEPVGRLIRRAKVTNQDGKRVLVNAYDREEFILSTDMNFRPVNTATGPDGGLYIVDMYRGIIQEGNWTQEGSFLRERIRERGLERNTGRGRIYRLVQAGPRRAEAPRMLSSPSAKLVDHLAHTNGWWRATAQKELVARGDLSVIPALREMALGNANHLARIHALWTLEGLDALDRSTLSRALADTDARVRKTAIWASETALRWDDPGRTPMLAPLADDPDDDVRIQTALTLDRFGERAATAGIIERATANTPVAAQLLASLREARAKRMLENRTAALPDGAREQLHRGQAVFRRECAACHGDDGRAIGPGGQALPAPPLVGSPRAAQPARVADILLHGMTGALDGREYPGTMVALGARQDDAWIADVTAYVRLLAHGEVASDEVPVSLVGLIRQQTSSRNVPYTQAELDIGPVQGIH